MGLCRLLSFQIFNSTSQSTCTLGAGGSSGEITIKRGTNEVFTVYDLEKYCGAQNFAGKRPDWLLIGRVDDEPWTAVFVEVKSGSDWDKALVQFQGVLPVLGKGGTQGGIEHHDDCRKALPLDNDHRVAAVVVGQVGRDMSKSGFRRGDRQLPARRRGLRCGSKEVVVASPMTGKTFDSLKAFFRYIGL